MSHEKPQHALDDYFSDLLGTPQKTNAKAKKEHAMALEKGAVSAAKPTLASTSPTLPRPDVAEQIEKAEQEKRKRVQALLDSAVPVTTKTATSAAPAPKVAAKIEVPKVETLKVENLKVEAFKVESALKQAVDIPVHTELKPQTVAKTHAKTATTTPPLVDKTTAPTIQDSNDPLQWFNGRPVWAQSRFDVLLFTVSGLTLAVPLVALGQIHRLTDELTPLFGQSDWFMGLLPTAQGQLKTVNTARFVMPERYDERFVESTKFVVSIDNSNWGLAVESVNQPVTLSPEDVKWRDQRSKRPWLAGTVKSSMCALLDIPRIGKMLADADRSKK